MEAEPEDPPVPERFLPGGRWLILARGPSTEGSDSVPRLVPYDVGESTEGSDNIRTSPRRESAVHTPHGQGTKPPSPQAGPAAVSDEEIGLVGPSSPGEMEASLSKPPNPPRTKHCPTCGKACHSTKILNKHVKEVHMGTPFICRWCPKKYKTKANRTKHEKNSCPSRHSPGRGRLARPSPRPPSPTPPSPDLDPPHPSAEKTPLRK